MPQNVHIVVNKHTPFVVEAFEKIGRVTALDTKEITGEAVKDADILIVRSETKVDADLMEGSRIKFVGTVTIGTDHVDEKYLRNNGIKFVSAPGSNSNSVGEYVTAALLELACVGGFELRGKTLGIVGVGNVGRKVWRKAEALGMRVLLNDPPLERTGSKYPLHSLDELMEADIVTLHVPLTRTGTDATFHLFDEQRISMMKPGAMLINTSRGAVVETEALKKALDRKRLSASVIDVWEKEPRIDASLLDLVTIGTPHIAGYSLDGKVNALRMNYEAVCDFLSIKCKQDIDNLVPPIGSPVIKPDNDDSSEEEFLRNIIRKCYDILADDKSLRNIISVPEEERAKYFSRLRSGYGIRREFFNRTVVLPANRNDLSGCMETLGFKIKIQQE
jgi:erythronate-4-phosphate dehydrogenase